MASASVQLISTDTLDSSALVVFATENERFMFDCGEGTQRLCTEHKVRLQKVEGIFFTETRTETIFGLPGLCLTIADGGKKNISILGPSGVAAFWKSTSRFMYRPDLNVSIRELDGCESVSHKECSVHCIPLPGLDGAMITRHASYICETFPKPGKFDVKKAVDLGVPRGPMFSQLKSGEDIVLEDGRAVLASDVVATADPGRSAAVVCRVDQNRVEDLVSMQAWSRYTDGGVDYGLMDVVVHLSGPATLDYPQYLAWMRSFGPSVQHVFAGAGSCTGKTAFQASTIQTRKLKKFMPTLFPSLPMVHPCRGAGVPGPAALMGRAGTPSLKFNLLPKSKYGWETAPAHGTADNLEAEAERFFEEIFSEENAGGGPEAGEGRRLLNEMNDVQGQSDRFLRSERSIDELNDTIVDRYGLETAAAGLLAAQPSNFLWFLGTGCAIPSKYRNVTAIFLQMAAGAVLFDAGEGTWYQLLRMAEGKDIKNGGSDAIVHIAMGLSVIWISHPHADHHLGLIQVLSERKKSFASNFRPVVLIAPYSVLGFVDDYAKIDPFIKGSYVAVPNSFFDPSDMNYTGSDPVTESKRGGSASSAGVLAPSTCLDNIVIDLGAQNEVSLCGVISSSLDFARQVFRKLNITKLSNVKVNHCSQAYGVRIWTVEGWSLVFSGDTRPCHELIELGKGATILIHEATFDNSKGEEAIQKKHSTVAEAYDVHHLMGSFRLILTHFSQRYPTIPPYFRFETTSPDGTDGVQSDIEDASRHLDAIFACDFMELSFSDMLWAPSATAAMAVAFPVVVEEEDEETATVGEESGTEPVRKKQKKT